MTTISTQTVDAFQGDMSPPPPPTEDELNGDLSSIYHGTWPVDKVLWHSGPSSVGGQNSIHSFHSQDNGSVVSFRSNAGSASCYRNRAHNQQLGTKVEMVYSLLSMLGSHDKDDMSRKLLSMSSSVDSCVAMRQSGCLPLLIELLHGDDKDGCMERQRPSRDTRRRASKALHNIVHSHPDDKRGRREARVLRLLEQIRAYCDTLRDPDSGSEDEQGSPEAANADQHPVSSMAMLMKLSFDEEHRHAMCQLGGLQTIAELVQVDYEAHGNVNDQYCITLRRYAGMALTNLTFGDGTNKALLCSLKSFMKALVAQLHSPIEDLRQVIASVLRNLSWRADQASKKTLREVGAVPTLMKAAMEAKKESTLKSILSALWNLSAHCSMNKADICTVDGSLGFLVGTLTYKSPSKTHAIVENGGGILRNISSHVAVREDYRAVLRRNGCLHTLLQHLRSPSLTIVSNACGTLWNISARCSEDQQTLWDMGAVNMLRNLVHSKHKMISMGSSAALKNLLAARPGGLAANADRHGNAGPSLLVRKQRALEAELDQNLTETCENLDSPKTSPTHNWCLDNDPRHGPKSTTGHQANGGGGGGNTGGSNKIGAPVVSPYQLHGRMYHSVNGHLPPSAAHRVSRSESKESVASTQSDSSHDRLRNLNLLLRYRQERLGHNDEGAVMPTMASLGLDHRLADVPPEVMESRIQYVMQEVTRQIANENQDILTTEYGSCGLSYLKSSSKTSTPRSGDGHTTTTSDGPAPVNQRAATTNNNVTRSTVESTVDNATVTGSTSTTTTNTTTNSTGACNAIFGKYPNLTSMMENLNLDEDDGDRGNEQPVNYSLKYSEEAGQRFDGRKRREGDANVVLDEEEEEEDQPKVDNDVAAVVQYNNDQDVNSNELRGCDEASPKGVRVAWQPDRSGVDVSDADAEANRHNDVYSHYAETDLDDPDQPTNYSLRYTEDNDTTDEFCPPAPEDEKPYFTREYPGKGPSVHDDTYKSYCTEDTPLNFSTATSMTDLRDINDVEAMFAESDSKCNIPASPPSGETPESRGAKTGPTANKHLASNGGLPTVSEMNSLVKSTPETASSDKVVTYCMEGTPICFSRVSSLSSIHSNDDFVESSSPPLKVATPPLLSNECHSEISNKDGRLSVDNVAETDSCSRRQLAPPSVFDTDHHGKSQTMESHEGKTVTFGKDHFAEETPLMFSRCSSLGSLSSFEQHSIHDDRSSVISDFSRRASEVVSPSDLPDSPGQTMPPSPRPMCAPAQPLSFSGKVNTECSIQPRVKREPPPPPPPRKSSMSKASFFDNTSRPDHNQEQQQQHRRNPDTLPDSKSSPDTPESDDKSEKMSSPAECNSPDEKDVISANLSDNEDDQDEDDLLAACINSAMPNNARNQHGSDGAKIQNNVKLSSRINMLDSGSGELGGGVGLHRLPRGVSSSIPVKANNVRIGYGATVGLGGVAMAAATTCKSVNEKVVNQMPHELQPEEEVDMRCDNSSDTSSVFDTDDNDKMLAQCIQSGMPKTNYSQKVVHATNLLDRCADTGVKDRYRKTQFRHAYPAANAASSTATTANNKVSNVSAAQPRPCVYRDTVTVFADEGTPINFSTATSLSDLTVDDSANEDDGQRQNRIGMRELSATANDQSLDFKNLTSGFMKSELPLNGQHNKSVNDVKNCRAADDKFTSDKDNRAATNTTNKNMTYTNNTNTTTNEHTSNGISLRAARRHEFDNDVPRSFAVEGTPVNLSRGSSLSSLSMCHDNQSEYSAAANFGATHLGHQQQQQQQHKLHHPPLDQHIRYEVEGTPACFSRNSSLSSLSVESLGVEPTPSEQALLDECISSGMPKSRSSGRSRGSRLPCPVSAKERHSNNGGVATNVNKPISSPQKMDSIQESGRGGGSSSSPDISPDRARASSSPCEWGATGGPHKPLQNSPNIANGSSSMTGNSAKETDLLEQRTTETEKQDEDEKERKAEVVLVRPKIETMVDRLTHVLSVVEEEDRSIDEPLRKSLIGAQDFVTCDDELAEEVAAATGRRLIELEATRVAVEVQNVANLMPDDMEQSVVSQSSEWIDSVKPPSLMGEVLTASMINSANSEGVSGGSGGGGRRSSSTEQSLPGRSRCASRTRNVPELVVRALGGSLENLSLRGSTTSVNGDLIDQVKPPSIMEDVDMSSSTYSVCSITSEVADPRSEEGFSMPSDLMFGCMRSAVAMAELYAARGTIGEHGIMGVSSNPSNQPSVSDVIENVCPPSVLLEMTDTLNDCTEVGTDTLENNNDTDVEDDLPDDREPAQFRYAGYTSNKNHSGRRQIQRMSAAPLGVAASPKMELPNNDDDDDAIIGDRELTEFVQESDDLDFLPDVDVGMLNLREDANLVLSTLNEIQFNEFAGEESISEDMLIECETLSLVSNESDSSSSSSDEDDEEARDSSDAPRGTQPTNRGPRIVKPTNNREAIHLPAQQQKDEEKLAAPKAIRGRRKGIYPRQQLISSFSNTRFSSPKPKEMAVKPTRTSALRATQSQQKVVTTPVATTPEVVATRPEPPKRVMGKSKSSLGGSGEIKTVRPGNAGRTSGIDRNYDSDPVDVREHNKSKPKPPIKQGTFTKDKPTLPKTSPTKTRIPTLGGDRSDEKSPMTAKRVVVTSDDRTPPRIGGNSVPAALRTRLGQSRSLDECKGGPTSTRHPPTRPGSKLPPSSLTGEQSSNGVRAGQMPPRRGQSSPPVTRQAIRTTAIRNSPSTHSLNGASTTTTTTGGAKRALSKTGSLNGTLNTTKRSSSNASLCSNTSSSTNNSRKSLGGSGGNVSTMNNGQRKISGLWKSSDGCKASGDSDASPTLTPKEGLSRSSTYEKIPTFGPPRLPVADDTISSGQQSQRSGSSAAKSETLTKESIRLLAETRLQRWAARKARILARKNSEGEGSVGSGDDVGGQLSVDDNSEGTPASSGGEEVVHHRQQRLARSSIRKEENECSTEDERISDEAASINRHIPSGTASNNLINNNNVAAESRVPASAIVPPFNYTPSTRTGTKGHQRSLIPTLNHMVVSPSPRQQQQQRDAFLHTAVEADVVTDSKHCLVTTV